MRGLAAHRGRVQRGGYCCGGHTTRDHRSGWISAPTTPPAKAPASAPYPKPEGKQGKVPLLSEHSRHGGHPANDGSDCQPQSEELSSNKARPALQSAWTIEAA